MLVMKNKILERKKHAFEVFKEKLFESDIKDKVDRIILYGSIVKNKLHKESDIDVLIISFNPIDKVEKVCENIADDILFKYGELIESMVYCIDDYRRPYHFLKNARLFGREVYKMQKDKEAKLEAGDYLPLAKGYLKLAKSFDISQEIFIRGAIDMAYNTIELCAKALLRLKLATLPKTHSGIGQKFSEVYVKTRKVDIEFGQILRRGLMKRNKARYDPHFNFSSEDSKELIEYAEKFIKLLEDILIAEI